MSAVAKPLRTAALFSPGWPPGEVPNGIVSYVGILYKEFIEQKRPVRVIALDASRGISLFSDVEPIKLPATHLLRCAERIIYRLPTLNGTGVLEALRIVQGIDVSGIHTHGLLEMEESFGMAGIVKKLTGVPVIVRLHGPWFLTGPALGVPIDVRFVRKNTAERKAILAADGLTSPSKAVLQAVRDRYEVPLSHAAVIPNPVPETPAGKRWTLTGAGRGTVLFVGRFDRCKGGDVIIDAFERISKHVPYARLIFVGPDRGLITDSGASLKLSEYIRTHLSPEARSRVQVMGSLSLDNIEPLRRASMVTVVASRYENFCLALLESLSYGCPTVASNAGGNSEILKDGKTGLLCKPGDPESLAEKIIELLQSPYKAAELGAAAAMDVSQRFSPGYVANQTWSYYEQVWDRASRARPVRPLSTLLRLFRM